ncbi:MAG TPA: hypothetical protein DD670_17985 [Planctomycetaceae bacterium]|nr:hypothetical protein [Planctomycetaceae bacterium]
MKRRDFLQSCATSLAIAATANGASVEKSPEVSTEDMPSIDGLSNSAVEHFLPGKRSCSESLLLAGCESLHIKSDLVPDIALGLAGGVGLQGDTCGILTGAALVLSLAISAKEDDYAKKKERIAQAAGRVYREFKREFGATDCRTLCGLDLTTEKGRRELAEGVKARRCAKLVAAGAKLLTRELEGL